MQEKRLKISPIKERILQLIDFKGIKKSDFYKITKIHPANFKANGLKSEIGGEKLVKILSLFPEINPEWLITGRGEMLRNAVDVPAPVEMLPAPAGQGIPLVNASANAGYGNFDMAALQKDVKEHYVIPKFRHLQVDFLIEIAGSSMSPKYYPGDLIAVRRLDNPGYIQWNRPHLIGTRDQGLLVKRIHPGSDKEHYLFKSDNPDYPPFEIPKSDITGIGLVVGVIRAE